MESAGTAVPRLVSREGVQFQRPFRPQRTRASFGRVGTTADAIPDGASHSQRSPPRSLPRPFNYGALHCSAREPCGGSQPPFPIQNDARVAGSDPRGTAAFSEAARRASDRLAGGHAPQNNASSERGTPRRRLSVSIVRVVVSSALLRFEIIRQRRQIFYPHWISKASGKRDRAEFSEKVALSPVMFLF